MALTSFSSPYIIAKKSGIPVRPGNNKVIPLKHRQIPIKKAPELVVRCSSKNKVFENVREGIICYEDENGEITCEGYDEGPRFHQLFPRTPHNPSCRDAHIINLLQQRLLRIVNGSETRFVAVQEDSNFNASQHPSNYF